MWLTNVLPRKSDTEVEFTSLAKFEFRVPFHVKHEANLLKVEVFGVKSRKSMEADRGPPSDKKRKGKQRSDDDDDHTDDEADFGGPEGNQADGLDVEELMAGEDLVAQEFETEVNDAEALSEAGTSSGDGTA